MTKSTTHKQRRAAKKLFPKKPHSTRPFTPEDYEALPVGEIVEDRHAKHVGNLTMMEKAIS